MTASPALDPSSSPRLPWGLAWRLAIGQVFAWGILLYAFTVIVGPMQADTGWSRPWLNTGLSLGLLTWGICAYPVGLWLQRRGARGLMTLATLGGAAALATLGLTSDPTVYLLAWVALGAAQAGQLYDPAFAVVTKAFGAEYRRGITLITLVGGLASTVFIPLAQLAVTAFGWRGAFIALAALFAAVVGPLHWWGLPAEPLGAPAATTPTRGLAQRLAAGWRTFVADVRDPRFLGLALWFAGHAAAFTGLMFQLIPWLQAAQVPDTTIVGAIAFMGPLQVAGRFFLATRGAAFSSLRVGVFAMAGLVLAVVLLLTLPPTLLWLSLFAGILGLGNGMLTIVRGTTVAEIFGRERYAEINGALSAPSVLAKASAPLVVAAVWSATGTPLAVPLTVLALLGLSVAGLVLVVRREQRASPALPPGP